MCLETLKENLNHHLQTRRYRIRYIYGYCRIRTSNFLENNKIPNRSACKSRLSNFFMREKGLKMAST